ncbi:MAG: ABC transporter ATP-binding protein, partial [Alphaproteobacteria bacterium]
HDRHLLEMTADRLILIDNGRAEEFAGSLDDYRDLLLGRGERKPAEDRPKDKRGNRKDERRAAAEQRERTKHLRTAAREAEKGMNLLSEKRTAIDQAIFDPDNAAEPYKGKAMSDLMKLRGEVEKKLERAETVWLEASEALENMSVENLSD